MVQYFQIGPFRIPYFPRTEAASIPANSSRSDRSPSQCLVTPSIAPQSPVWRPSSIFRPTLGFRFFNDDDDVSGPLLGATMAIPFEELRLRVEGGGDLRALRQLLHEDPVDGPEGSARQALRDLNTVALQNRFPQASAFSALVELAKRGNVSAQIFLSTCDLSQLRLREGSPAQLISFQADIFVAGLYGARNWEQPLVRMGVLRDRALFRDHPDDLSSVFELMIRYMGIQQNDIGEMFRQAWRPFFRSADLSQLPGMSRFLQSGFHRVNAGLAMFYGHGNPHVADVLEGMDWNRMAASVELSEQREFDAFTRRVYEQYRVAAALPFMARLLQAGDIEAGLQIAEASTQQNGDAVRLLRELNPDPYIEKLRFGVRVDLLVILTSMGEAGNTAATRILEDLIPTYQGWIATVRRVYRFYSSREALVARMRDVVSGSGEGEWTWNRLVRLSLLMEQAWEGTNDLARERFYRAHAMSRPENTEWPPREFIIERFERLAALVDGETGQRAEQGAYLALFEPYFDWMETEAPRREALMQNLLRGLAQDHVDFDLGSVLNFLNTSLQEPVRLVAEGRQQALSLEAQRFFNHHRDFFISQGVSVDLLRELYAAVAQDQEARRLSELAERNLDALHNWYQRARVFHTLYQEAPANEVFLDNDPSNRERNPHRLRLLRFP